MSYQKRMPDKIRVNKSELRYVRSNPYKGEEYEYQGRPFTGFKLSGYHNNGQVASEFEYVNGEELGWEITYYDNGQAESESFDYGATTVYYAEYDREGNKTFSGYTAEVYLKTLCDITGQNPDEVDR
jgi:antitoxin component YwqK of YwqJK toxin-antitoxin module